MGTFPDNGIEIKESERRRADNQIWNVAGDYDFTPDVRAYDNAGMAELYRNCIVGAAHKYFGQDLDPMWEKIHAAIAEDICEQLVWIGLENACFEREVLLRPALFVLRRNYAQKMLGDFNVNLPYPYDEVYRLSLLRMAGEFFPEEKEITGEEERLLSRLLFTGDMEAKEISAAALSLLDEKTLLIPKETEAEASEHHFHLKFIRKSKKTGSLPRVRKNGAGYMEHGDPVAEYVNTGKHYIFDMSAAQSDAAIRKYIGDVFGTPMFSQSTVEKIERVLCRDEHENCHLYYAIGDGKIDGRVNGYAEMIRKNAISRMAKNREYYRENYRTVRTAINRLTEKWQNALLTYRQDNTVRSDNGIIRGSLVWREEKVNDIRIFDRVIPADDGEIYVDILIDGSLSQEERQMKVALQAFIIAEALTRCRIPVRVCSFSSMSGYTVLTKYRDYDENELNDRIFNFSTFGGNRDGLAIRMVNNLMETDKEKAERRIFFVLSDTRPNDSINIISHGKAELYKGEAGVENTAKEVRTMKNKGVSVLCVYTGTDNDVISAHRIYNRDFVRIKRLEDFAQAVGGLFLTSIRD